MRRNWTTLVATAASLALVPQLAAADDSEVRAQLEAMQERMAELEQRLNATNDQLAESEARVTEQRVLIERAGIEEEGEKSALSSFLEDTDFAGWVAASYFYNVTDPRRASGGGENTTLSNPFHPDHNSFQLDELWLSAGRAADEDMRAGFQFDVLYGETANGFNAVSGIDSNSLWVNQAYVEYLSPFNVLFTAGKFGTHIGYEVAGAPLNVNITRGFVYNLLQPFSQIGLKAAVETDAGVNFMIGVVNGVSEAQVDVDDEKDLVWSLGFGTDTMAVSFNGQWGRDADTFGMSTLFPSLAVADQDEELILDLVAELTPTDNLLIWANSTFLQLDLDGTSSNPWAVGAALGTRVAVTDRMGVGVRGEYLRADCDGCVGSSGGVPVGVASLAGPAGDLFSKKVDLWSVTLTTDFALVENLLLKLEGKWEAVDVHNGPDDIFPDGGAVPNETQWLLGGQMVYTF